MPIKISYGAGNRTGDGRTRVIPALAGLMALLVPLAVAAAPVQVYFQLRVDSVSDAAGLFTGVNPVGPGNTFNGHYIYDDMATNLFKHSIDFDKWEASSLSFESSAPFVDSSHKPVIKAFVDTNDFYQLHQPLAQPGSSSSLFMFFQEGNFGYSTHINRGKTFIGDGLGHVIVPLPEPADVIETDWLASAVAETDSYLSVVNGTAALSLSPFATSSRPTPSPATLLLLAVGLAALAAGVRKR